MDDDETEEIVEIKDLGESLSRFYFFTFSLLLEYIQHSAKDTVWLQKKWFFILFVLLVNLGLVAAVIFTKGSAYIMVPFITLSHVR